MAQRVHTLRAKCRDVAVYQRFDKSRPGDLHRNSRAPDVPLHSLDGTPIYLRALHAKLNAGLEKALPLMILAGSVYLRSRAVESRMAYESVIETPGADQPVYARRLPLDERRATLRAATGH